MKGQDRGFIKKHSSLHMQNSFRMPICEHLAQAYKSVILFLVNTLHTYLNLIPLLKLSHSGSLFVASITKSSSSPICRTIIKHPATVSRPYAPERIMLAAAESPRDAPAPTITRGIDIEQALTNLCKWAGGVKSFHDFEPEYSPIFG